MDASPTFICLTPVKNEAWILERFLQCASTWADHIIIADQQSDDETRAIAKRFEKVTLIDNPHPGYDEESRQKLLIDAARRIPTDGPRILIALDADEILTANWMTSPEWTRLQTASPGTVITFQWANVGPNVSGAWLDDDKKPFGFVDDGTPHEGSTIHSPRVPVPSGAPRLPMEEIRVLHYQYANWERMTSKQRWYQCWERLNHPNKRPITIYRQYNFMHADVQKARPLPPAWLDGYEQRGIDMRTIQSKPYHYWDRAVLDLFVEHGVAPFRKLAIWDADWRAIAKQIGHQDALAVLEDEFPVDGQSSLNSLVLSWLSRTQARHDQITVRATQKLLQFAGW